MAIEQYRQVALLLLVSIAAVNDLATRRIPNRLILVGLAGALSLHLLATAPGAALLGALGGMGIALALFLPFYLLRGMAAGDVKLIAVVGAFTGPAEVFEIAVLSWLAGGLMGLVIVLLRRRGQLVLDNLKHMLRWAVTPGVRMNAPAVQASAGSMPYGLAIAIGTIVVLLRHYG
jgi:prepilin peptidase CpaA